MQAPKIEMQLLKVFIQDRDAIYPEDVANSLRKIDVHGKTTHLVVWGAMHQLGFLNSIYEDLFLGASVKMKFNALAILWMALTDFNYKKVTCNTNK